MRHGNLDDENQSNSMATKPSTEKRSSSITKVFFKMCHYPNIVNLLFPQIPVPKNITVNPEYLFPLDQEIKYKRGRYVFTLLPFLSAFKGKPDFIC